MARFFTMDQLRDKQTQVVMFSSTAIALYGYDQGTHSRPPLVLSTYTYLPLSPDGH